MEKRLGLYLMVGAAAKAYGMSKASNSSWGKLCQHMWALSSPRISEFWNTSGFLSGSPCTLDVAVLCGEVPGLTRQASKLNVHSQLGGRNAAWSVLVYPAVASGVCLCLYCKVTGTGVMDLPFVSRSSMTALRNTVQKGLSNVWGEMCRQKEEIVKVLSTLGSKQGRLQDNQEQLMDKQQKMDDLLQRVEGNVGALDGKAKHTINNVKLANGKLKDVHVGIQAANQGIYMLMAVLLEVNSKIGLHHSRAVQPLHRHLGGSPALESSINASPPSSSTTSSSASVDAAGAMASNSSHR